MQDNEFERFVSEMERLCIDYATTQMDVMRAMTRIFNGRKHAGKKNTRQDGQNCGGECPAKGGFGGRC